MANHYQTEATNNKSYNLLKRKATSSLSPVSLFNSSLSSSSSSSTSSQQSDHHHKKTKKLKMDNNYKGEREAGSPETDGSNQEMETDKSAKQKEKNRAYHREYYRLMKKNDPKKHDVRKKKMRENAKKWKENDPSKHEEHKKRMKEHYYKSKAQEDPLKKEERLKKVRLYSSQIRKKNKAEKLNKVRGDHQSTEEDKSKTNNKNTQNNVKRTAIAKKKRPVVVEPQQSFKAEPTTDLNQASSSDSLNQHHSVTLVNESRLHQLEVAPSSANSQEKAPSVIVKNRTTNN